MIEPGLHTVENQEQVLGTYGHILIDIYEDFDESEIDQLPISVQEAWKAGKALCGNGEEYE